MEHGITIAAVFDVDEKLVGRPIGEIEVSPYARLKDAVHDNPMFAVLDQPGIGRYPVAATPLQFGAVDRAPPQPAPVLGQHTDEILSSILGLPAHEIARLHDGRVVAGPQ